MVINRDIRRICGFGSVMFASVLSLGACADVDGTASDLGEDNSLAQTTTADAGAVREDLGKGNGNDVVMIGDSWMTMYGGGLQGGVEAANGPTTYRKYGVPGTQLLNNDIPNQFNISALRAGRDIKTVIMTGGGNDVLLNPVATAACRDPSCDTLKKISAGLVKLWNQMGAAGVKDVVYVGYSEGAGSSPAVVTNATKNGVGAACEAMTSIRCHVIDSTPIVHGRLLDGIHPTGAAHKDLGAAVYKLMEERGIRR